MFHDVEQNTAEWFSLRSGKITSSNFSKIMAHYNKDFGEPAKQYAVDICIERLTGKSISNNYTNSHMQRGHDEEPIARYLYENETFCDVKNGGFFENGDVGCSPDGLVNKDGLIEIKSVIQSVHDKNIKRQSVDPAYKWQCMGNLKITERNWIDFVSFCNDLPEDKKLYIFRMNKELYQDEFDMIDNRLYEFKELILETMNQLRDQLSSQINDQLMDQIEGQLNEANR